MSFFKTDLKWSTVQMRLGDLVPCERNHRVMSKAQNERLQRSLQRNGIADTPCIDIDGTIVSGHQRVRILGEALGPDFVIDVRLPSRRLSEKERTTYLMDANATGGGWDWDGLFNEFSLGELEDFGLPAQKMVNPEEEKVKEKKYKVVIECEDELMQADLVHELEVRGIPCKAK